MCAKESFGYPETVFDLQLPWLVLQLEKGCAAESQSDSLDIENTV